MEALQEDLQEEEEDPGEEEEVQEVGEEWEAEEEEGGGEDGEGGSLLKIRMESEARGTAGSSNIKTIKPSFD
jgi:hypothetical protein